MNTLFLLLGYPGSGKSTFSRQLARAKGFVRLNSDELRERMYGHSPEVHNPRNNPAVFGALDYATEQLLAAGMSVVYDANNNRYDTRQKHEQLAVRHNAQTVVLWITTALEVAKEREATRALDPLHIPIPPDVYDQTAKALQEPSPNEKVITIDGTVPFGQQLASFDEQWAVIA